MATSIPQEVLMVLSACSFDGPLCRLPEQLDRALYLKTNKVLEGLGGHWDRKAGGHVFGDEGAAVRVDEAILTGTYERPQNYDYFPTPRPLAEVLVRRARIGAGMRVLEPSAGDGSLVDAARLSGGFALARDFICFELQPDLRETLAGKGYQLDIEPDFLKAQRYNANGGFNRYHRVIMNPPFSRQQDVGHVVEALRYLAPDGLLVAIMSAGISFRANEKTRLLRELIAARGGSITANPEGSFKPSGTNVNTCMVMIPGGAA